MSRTASKQSTTSFHFVQKDPLELPLGSKDSVGRRSSIGSAAELLEPLGALGGARKDSVGRRSSIGSTPVGAAYSVARSRSKTQLRAAMTTQDQTAKMRRIATALKPFKNDPGVLGQDGLDAAKCLKADEVRLIRTADADADEWSKMVQFQAMLHPLHTGTAVSLDIGAEKVEVKNVAVFAKGRKSLLAGLKDGSLERVVNEMEEQKRLIAAELQGLENMELSIPEFIKAFRKNDNIVNKVALTTGIDKNSLKSFKDDDLKKWFIEMDTDQSGTLSFDEFVEGIVAIREAQLADEAQKAKNALFKKGRRTLLAGLKDGSLERVVSEMEEKKAMIATELEGYETMNLSTDEFIKALRTDKNLVQKVSFTAGIAVADLESLKEEKLRSWFKDMDEDGDGRLSFDEFVEGVVKIQEERKASEASSTKLAVFKKGRNSLLAGLKDGSLERVVNEMEEQKRLIAEELKDFETMEHDIPTFINMFRTNVKLLNKVAVATDMSVDELKKFDDKQLNTWFVEMDTDQSGTLSFDEFVEGIATIREKQKKGEKVALFQKGRKSLLAGLRDGSLERVVSEMEAQKAAVAAELGETFEELETDKFIEKFRTDKKLVAKVAEQTGIELNILTALDDAKLKVWFTEMDEDQNGKLSFDEFVEGIIKIREEQKKDEAKSAKLALFQKGRKTLLAGLKDGTLEKVVSEMEEQKAMVAAEFEGFEKMELSIPEFIKVFRKNQNLVNKIVVATGVLASDLNAMEDATMAEWFKDMDTDGNGTLSFDEFVEGIMKIREEQLSAQAKDAKLALFKKGRKSLLAGLKDGTLAKAVDDMEEKGIS